MNDDNNVVRLDQKGQTTGGGDGGGNFGERIAKIEAILPHLATKADIEGLKTLIEKKNNALLYSLLSLVGIALISLIVTLFRSQG